LLCGSTERFQVLKVPGSRFLTVVVLGSSIVVPDLTIVVPGSLVLNKRQEDQENAFLKRFS
jgi:hypothetical protein